MADSPWYHRYSWIVFVIVALTGLIPAIQFMVAPLSGTSFFASFGHPVPESILSNPETAAFLAFLMRWIGTVLLGGNLLTVFIALTAWRDGQAWAWLAMWYWPFLFGVHFLMYSAGLLRTLQLVWVAITVLVLVSNASRFGIADQLPD